MRVVVDILLLLPAFAWQSALAGHFQVRGVGLDLLAVMLASISLNQGWLYGAIGGLICGVMMDSVFGMTGFYALQYMALGMAVGLAGEKFRMGNWIGPLAALFAAYVLKELVPVTYLFFADAQVRWSYALFKVLASGAVTAAVFLPVHALVRLLHRWDVISAPVFHFHGRKW